MNKKEEAKKVSKALMSGNLRLVSKSGYKVPVKGRLVPKISQNWGCEFSFNELCAKAIFCYRLKKGNRDEMKPHFVIAEIWDEKLEGFEISNDSNGIFVSAYFSVPKQPLLKKEAELDISLDGNKLVCEYLAESGADDLIVTEFM